jgi:uncharacterized protein
MLKSERKPGESKTVYPAEVGRAIESIAQGYSPNQIWLFGSYARGDYHRDSDLDLIMIKETNKKLPDRIEDVLQYCPPGLAVEPLVYTRKEKDLLLTQRNRFLEQAFSEGVLVHEQ